MNDTGKYLTSMCALARVFFLLFCPLFLCSISYADNHFKINVDPDALIRSLPVCAKQSKPLSKGTHHGNLKSKASTQVYSGPSVLCPPRGHLRPSIPFVVKGQVSSSFGKPWYMIESLDATKQRVWVPAKYISLGKKYNPVPGYTTQALNDIEIKTDRNLNVRKCPSTSCLRLTSLNQDELYIALNKSSNDWYEINVGDITGWVSGRYVEIVETESIPERPEVQEEFEDLNTETKSVIPDIPDELVVPFDPCKEFVAVKEYEQTNIWRVQKPFQVRQAAHNQCATLDNINIDQAIVSFGEAGKFYQIGYISLITSNYEVGFLEKSKFDEHYIPMQLLTNPKDVDDVAYKLKESQEYWTSWQYQRDVMWNGFKRFYSQNPIIATLLVFGGILSILYAIPFTRGFARNVVVTIFQAINDIIEWLIGLFLRRKLRVISSHWNTMVEGLTITPSEFYAELKRVLEEKQLPDSRQFEIKHKEGGIFSSKRVYLRVTRKNHAFDICGAPFGNGTFFSWWLGELPSWFFTILYSLPIFYWIAVLLQKLFKPETYYRYDSMAMFQALVHSAVIEVVDQYTNDKGLVRVGGDDRKPKMKNFFDKSN